MIYQHLEEINLQAGCKAEVSLLNSHEKERKFRRISVNRNSKYILVFPFSLLLEYISHTGFLLLVLFVFKRHNFGWKIR